MKSINWVGVILGLIVAQAVGMLWYGFLFMERWVELELGGTAPSEAEAMTALWQGALLNLLQAAGLAWLINRAGANSYGQGALIGLVVSVFFASAVVVQNWIYAGIPLELVAINASYQIVWLTLAGALIGGVRLKKKAPAAAAA
jgi:hypothetical protein